MIHKRRLKEVLIEAMLEQCTLICQEAQRGELIKGAPVKSGEKVEMEPEMVQD